MCIDFRVKFPSVCSFITSEISSLALLIGRTIFFHSEILSHMLWLAEIEAEAKSEYEPEFQS